MTGNSFELLELLINPLASLTDLAGDLLLGLFVVGVFPPNTHLANLLFLRKALLATPAKVPLSSISFTSFLGVILTTFWALFFYS